MQAGAPARQAELQAVSPLSEQLTLRALHFEFDEVRHRYNLLLQTAAEWREVA